MFSHEVERALRVMMDAHDGQVRKCAANVPYVVHPIHVALMLARWGLDETTIISALLHDVVEDCEDWTRERIESEFGPRVASIVAELTEDKSLGWDERKQAAVDHVPRMSTEACAIKAMDKLHNLESILADLREAEDSADVWKSFRGGRDKTLAMAEKLVVALEKRLDPRLARALRAGLDALMAEATQSPAEPAHEQPRV